MAHRATQNSLRDQDYRGFANAFVDLLLDRRKTWLFEFIWRQGLATVPDEEELHSGALAARIAYTLYRGPDSLIEGDLYEAYQRRDRQALVDWFYHRAKKARLTQDAMTRMLAIGNDAVLQRSLKELKAIFSFQRGPRIKVPPWKYPALLRTARTLHPCILSVLLEIEVGTKHGLRDMLEYRKPDFPQASAFLLHHLSDFSQALNDSALLTRGKKLATRARVLADALAGSEYGLKFTTSVERVGEARRSSKRVR